MTDLVFSATSSGTPVYWMVKFAASTQIGYALVLGEYSTNGMDWYLTFGNSADPTANPIFYTAATNVEWAKEVEINS